jgi:hypothetical protein
MPCIEKKTKRNIQRVFPKNILMTKMSPKANKTMRQRARNRQVCQTMNKLKHLLFDKLKKNFLSNNLT